MRSSAVWHGFLFGTSCAGATAGHGRVFLCIIQYSSGVLRAEFTELPQASMQAAFPFSEASLLVRGRARPN